MVSKQRGLGRGLDALFEDEETKFAAAAAPAEPPSSSAPKRTLGIGQLSPDPNQPRQFFDDKALSELTDSIKTHGLIQPILVRPHPHEEGRYEIVAGERRWRAAQRAQLHEVPVIIREMDDATALQIALIENLQRQDLNAIEEAKGYQRLFDEFAYTQEKVAETVGKSRSYVANIVRLLQLPISVQSLVSKNELSAGHARALINAKNPALLAQEIISKGLSVRQTEKLAAQDAGRSVQPRAGAGVKSQPPKDVNIAKLEKDMSDALGMNVLFTMKDNKSGAVSISFSSLDQLDFLLRELCRLPGANPPKE